jgi:hypothetical protein
MDDNILEGLEALDADKEETEEVVETDETLNEEDGIVDIEVDVDDGLLGELNTDVPDVAGSVTLNCTSCSALYLQLIGDPDDDQDQMFAKSITEMTATCPQCGDLTRQVIVSAPLTAPEPTDNDKTVGEGKTKLLSSDRFRIRQYGKSPARIHSCVDTNPQINSSMMTKVQSNVEGGVGSFRRFTDNDWAGYAGATQLPDGSEPLSYYGKGDGIGDVLITGDETAQNSDVYVIFSGYDEAADETFELSRKFNSVDAAVRFGEELTKHADSPNTDLDWLSDAFNMIRII